MNADRFFRGTNFIANVNCKTGCNAFSALINFSHLVVLDPLELISHERKVFLCTSVYESVRACMRTCVGSSVPVLNYKSFNATACDASWVSNRLARAITLSENCCHCSLDRRFRFSNGAAINC